MPRGARFVRAAGLVVATLLFAAVEAAAGQLMLAWDPSQDAVAGYVVYYGTAPGSHTGHVDVGSETSATVDGLTAGVRYYFVVKAYSSSGLFSAASNEVSALVAALPSFTDDPLLPGVHTMKAVHITELRTRIDALRSERGLSNFPWASLAVGTLVRAAHIAELRTALEQMFAERGLPASAYLDGMTVGASLPIRASHIAQLRSAVIALE